MIAALKQLFAAITVLFSAVEKGAKTIDNIAAVGEEMSSTYLDEAKIKREEQRAVLQAKLDAVRANNAQLINP